MNVGVIGAGRIGGNAATLLARAGHPVLLSFAKDPARLERLAADIGPLAKVGTPRDAVEFGDVVIVSVPWSTIDAALAEAGSLEGKIVIDTTNQFVDGVVELPGGMTAAQFNQGRMRGARLVKAFNTLTSGFQAQAAGREGPDRVVMFMCGDDADAKAVASKLIDDTGFAPFDLGGLADAAPMEAPRRPGAVYGEEYHLSEAEAFLAERTRRSEETKP
jgi:8-hydroxy-5-deazaflavin:NADPH oxidoreductase